VPVILLLQAEADAFAPDASLTVSASSDFLHTLTFAQSGPAFTLPEGFTANSVGGNIVDNQFVGGEADAVPEPATLALVSSGLLAIASARRRRRA
jgi:hypothetical protein